MIWCFGDSWGYGSELNENENPFVYHLAKDLGEKFINFSSQGNSYSVIVTRIFGNVRDINSDDTILIVIPPDIRWMDQQQGSFISWYYEADKERYMSLLGDKT